MYLLIVLLPLFGSISAGFFGRFLGEEGAARVTTAAVFFTFTCSVFAFYEVGFCGNPTYVTLFTWIDSGLFVCHWGLLFDSLTVVILIVVTSVSTLVHLYSISYITGDPHRSRFISYLSLFTFFMLILVTGDNFLQMFVGWEGVGLCSYLLINFWYTRIQANKAAVKAMIINRVGDVGLALGIITIFYEFQSVDYTTVFATAAIAAGHQIVFFNLYFDSLTLISLLLFVGAVGKSAQLGLHTWLPDAMEGPTPVSALIHAATMVTAGVFLLARCSPLLEYAPKALAIITFFGAITAFFAATTGLLQNDIKRVIAYSTCSQLGYMVFACGLSAYNVGVFHLANHAFFKALLFLSAGSVIHAMVDEQDIRKMGGLSRVLPFTYAMVFIGSLALMGFPFLTGFYSKDVVLEVAYASYTVPGHFAHWLGTLAAFFTAFYSIRLLHLTFLSEPNGHFKSMVQAHDVPLFIGLPLFLLSLGSIFVGFFSRDIIIGSGTGFWSNALFIHPSHLILLEAEFIPTYIKLVPVIFSLFGAGLAFYLYSFKNYFLFNCKFSSLGRKVYLFLNRKWLFDKVYTELLCQPLLHHGYHTTYKAVDRGLVELFGPFGFSNFFYGRSSVMSSFQTGYLFNYTLVILVFLSFFLGVLLLCQTGLVIFFDSRLYWLFGILILLLS